MLPNTNTPIPYIGIVTFLGPVGCFDYHITDFTHSRLIVIITYSKLPNIRFFS